MTMIECLKERLPRFMSESSNKEKQEPESPSRRRLLKGGVAILAAMAMGGVGCTYLKEWAETERQQIQAAELSGAEQTKEAKTIAPEQEALYQPETEKSQIEGTVPLCQQEVRVPGDFKPVDLEILGPEKCVYKTRFGDNPGRIAQRFLGDWDRWPEFFSGDPAKLSPGTVFEFEISNQGDKELKDGELGDHIPVYDFTEFRKKEDLVGFLDEAFYPTLSDSPIDSRLRVMELFISKSMVDEFRRDDTSVVGWSNKQIGYLNALLKENNLTPRLAIKRVIIVDDRLAGELHADWHFWQGRNEYKLPRGITNRWVMNGYYREGPYYNEKLDCNIGWLHENTHYFFFNFDEYFADHNPANGVAELRLKDGTVISPEEQTLSLPENWLMVGSKKRPVLSPISLATIKYFEEIGILSWEEAYDYWTQKAFFDIKKENYVYFRDKRGNPLSGKVSLFIARPDRLESFTLHRHYETEPDEVLKLDEESKVLLPLDLVRGFAHSSPHPGSPDDVLSFPKNFLLIVEDETGGKKVCLLNSYDFWLASREAGRDRPSRLIITLD